MTRQLTIIFILTTILVSCSTNKKEPTTKRLDKFTWNVQLAGYDFSHYDQKGETNYYGFIDEFERFPWMVQLDSAAKIQSGCAPTLSVKDLESGMDLWVSMAGDRSDHGYLIGYIYPKEKKGFFGLGAPKTIRWVEIYLTEDKHLVKDCFKLFFGRHHDQLEKKIRRLEEYGQIEALDLAE